MTEKDWEERHDKNCWQPYTKENRPKLNKRYWVKLKNGEITFDIYKHRVLRGGGMYVDCGDSFAGLIDKDVLFWADMDKSKKSKECDDETGDERTD